jgi:hypothetical protein
VAAIQHVRRRETVAMTPADSLIALQSSRKAIAPTESTVTADKKAVLAEIKKITNTNIETCCLKRIIYSVCYHDGVNS